MTVRIARKDERSTGITFRQDDATSSIIAQILEQVMRRAGTARAA